MSLLGRILAIIGAKAGDAGLPPGMDAKIANRALDLSMDWGEDFLKPTQPRMAKLFPQLTPAELDAYDALARRVTKFATNFLYNRNNSTAADLSAALLARFSWVSGDNLSRMYSQGMYYAWK